MPKTAELKLTSEERCRKAFEKAFVLDLASTDEATRTLAAAFWTGWEACWKHLESKLAEFVRT